MMDTLREIPSAHTFVNLVEAAQMTDVFSGQAITAFVPVNDAYNNLPRGTVNRWMQPNNRETLKTILSYHLIKGNASSAQFFPKTANYTSLQGEDIVVNGESHQEIMINNARLISPDIKVSNGTIHMIDRVLIPQAQSYRAF